MKIVISGGAGFVGGCLVSQLRVLGHHVTVLAHRASGTEPDTIPFSLEKPISPAQLSGFDALIHAAYDFTATDRRNVEGSIRLFDAAAAAGVQRLVFISSLSAFKGCRSQYGAMKLAVEEHLERLGGCSVRLGFLCEASPDSNRGFSGALRKLARLPVIPLPWGGNSNLFAIQAEDLGPAFIEILKRCRQQVIHLAHPKPLPFAHILRTFAAQQGKRPMLIPVPWRLLWMPLRVMEGVGINLRFRADNLVSLMNQNPSPDFRLLDDWYIRLRPFD